MKHIFKITTAILAILLALALYKLDEKEFQLQSALMNMECQFNKELADAVQLMLYTKVVVDKNGNTYLDADEYYFKEHNIPIKYYKTAKRSAKQLGKDYKKAKKMYTEEYGEDNMPSLQESIEQQRQALLDSKNQQ